MEGLTVYRISLKCGKILAERKVDEICEGQEELGRKVKDTSSIHYYQAGKFMMGEWKGAEADIINSAAMYIKAGMYARSVETVRINNE